MLKIALSTLQTFVSGVMALGLALFLPAGTLDYWQAWIFILVFMTGVCALGLYLTFSDPALLERRKQFGPAAEQRPAQRLIIALSLIGVLGVVVLSGVDFRFGWSQMPGPISIAGNGLVLGGLAITLLVVRENTYGSSTIRVIEGQRVISTGPYAIVRHPMYAGALVMMIGVPIALGSWWALLFLALITPLLIWRIFDEEQALRQDLPGYADYLEKVRFRLVPYVW